MKNSSILFKPTAEYMTGARWIRDHLPQLVRAYPNQWIGVHQGRVVGANADLSLVAVDAEKNAPAEDVAYHFVDDGTLIF